MVTSPPIELTTYHGNCHCGAVHFIVRIPELSAHEVGSCNCSICTRNGYLMVYPSPENVEFTSGKESMAEFRFGVGAFVHRFCKTCGSSVSRSMMADGEAMLAINVHMLYDVNTDDLKLKLTDGKAFGAPYTYPLFPEAPFSNPPVLDTPLVEFEADPALVEYPANCQCGAVTYKLRVPPITENTVKWCNCSICERNAYLLVYPHKHNVFFHTGYDELAEYSFNTNRNTHKFCTTCGSSVMIDMHGFGQEKWAMNVRMLKDVDLKAFTYSFYDGKNRLQVPYTIGKPAST